ncbi:uncharacterized protein F4807DRAFT_190642 [Annulohypoxylon truncatum]|uniref:uncharacterized protein n=1 Tax=Annulohypoxylon truncatum TaxID=327061 RepID=UPI00200832F7|nr:uncharacterized protein F4807DRAFT_190642 [Annulohypoxylon truncatum]KAI1207197.1 hypothetical protein F4807DRAFT_190642 [Annulohypoxylon truncatum]
MAYNNTHFSAFQYASTSTAAPPQPPRSGRQLAQRHHYLNHKVSDLSDGLYDGAASPAGLRGRESLVSLQSSYESARPNAAADDATADDSSAYDLGSSWSVPFVGSGGGRYQPISSSGRSDSNYAYRFKSFRARARDRDTIYEDDSIDMSLLNHAARPERSNASHSQSHIHGPSASISGNEPASPAVDITSFEGPMCAENQEFFTSLQAAQEASGQLTGGLGSGLETPKARIDGAQLVASSPLKRSFTRTFSMRRSPACADLHANLKVLGQSEANRRGEVIEVVMDEEREEEMADVDISTMVGPSSARLDHDRDHIRNSVLPRRERKTEVFYPQPNWKPFSMRWPYLTWLILLSIGLAIAQEILYQRSLQEPLVEFQRATDLGAGYYFIIKFVPTIITVTFGVLWQNTDFEVKRLEAYYQLSKEGGALAAESINVNYITLFNFGRPFLALQRKHYAVAVSSIATILAVSLVPTLGSAALVVSEVVLDNGITEKAISINPVLSRILTMTFFVIAVLGCVLFYQLNTRRSGLSSDVMGIAGLASMAVASHIMMDFKDMDVAPPKEIHRRLKNRRYALRNSSLVPEDSQPSATSSSIGAEKYKETDLPENPHPLMLRAEGCIPFIVFVLLFLGFIPVFLFTPASALTTKAPWVVTMLAVCIKLTWGSLETAIRMMEPYYILSKRHAPAKTLTLDYTAMPFAVVAAHALFNRHWTVFVVGFGTILVEALTIFATSLATVEGKDFLSILSQADPGNDKFLQKGLGSGSETVLSFSVILALTVVILTYLIVVATTVFIRRRHPFLPRQPNTISSVLAFMHQSKMLYDFVGTAKLDNAQMLERLEGLGKTYGLGWFDGRDDMPHLGIEQEELTGSYKHGVNYAQGNKPWLTEWQLF